ncbi:EPIDERMAL PATTERNING FACTOR-like protein 2 [Magnolia sinica]|uniref:EPIDERMAL PATTERNING FACTOR-like protein 2 n=1 Tax=Magnolia sinica TaxID=86752 RepID=UPI002657C448|nr:EPIDERMAL PATTERNING FACTOR-like protein 2 [Magnolia sinica]
MGCSCNPICNHTHLYLLISFLLISSSTQMRFMVDGLKIHKFLEVSKVGEEEKMFLRARIGSRPPSCQRRCSSCGHCEAVQVPAVPQERSERRHSTRISTISSSREDTSNYKPMSWKCKCGDMIFNP